MRRHLTLPYRSFDPMHMVANINRWYEDGMEGPTEYGDVCPCDKIAAAFGVDPTDVLLIQDVVVHGRISVWTEAALDHLEGKLEWDSPTGLGTAMLKQAARFAALQDGGKLN